MYMPIWILTCKYLIYDYYIGNTLRLSGTELVTNQDLPILRLSMMVIFLSLLTTFQANLIF
jgi:hypothetical protein